MTIRPVFRLSSVLPEAVRKSIPHAAFLPWALALCATLGSSVGCSEDSLLTSTGGSGTGAASAGGGASTGSAPGTGGASNGFVHPGALDSQEELDFVKSSILAGNQPWTAKFGELKNLANRTPVPSATVNSSVDAEANAMKADARAAYAAALSWRYTGDASYADKAIAILNAWTVLESFTAGTDQDKLQAAWIGALFGPAAELVLGYEGWATADVEEVRAMFKRAFYPQLNTASTWNGNVDLTQIEAMLAIAVFNEDRAEFDAGLTRLSTRMPLYFYLESDGPNGNAAFWSSPTAWVDGLTQETCRDNGHHAQYAMSAAIGAAEVAWHQGVDVYTTYADRIVSAMELLATQITTGEMQGTCADDVTTTDRYATWEIGYHHYATVKGLQLPNSKAAIIEEIRPKGVSDWNIFYETLTHGDLP